MDRDFVITRADKFKARRRLPCLHVSALQGHAQNNGLFMREPEPVTMLTPEFCTDLQPGFNRLAYLTEGYTTSKVRSWESQDNCIDGL